MIQDPRNLNGSQFKAAFCYGTKQLSLNREIVNAINILPVPNGDTGDNIHKTLLSALSNMKTDGHIGNQARQCARGALLGAHGSSGIILANFFIGFADNIPDMESVSINELLGAINKGCERAAVEIEERFGGCMLDIYSAVNVRLSSPQHEIETLTDVMKMIYDIASKSLEETRIKNPLLSKAGVNDAGAAGLFYFIEGIYRYAMNISLKRAKSERLIRDIPEDALIKDVSYTVEFLINNVTSSVEEIKKSFFGIGNSIFLAYDDGSTIKVLMRTDDPRKVFDRSSRFGKSTMIRVNDLMDEQNYFLSKVEINKTLNHK